MPVTGPCLMLSNPRRRHIQQISFKRGGGVGGMSQGKKLIERDEGENEMMKIISRERETKMDEI